MNLFMYFVFFVVLFCDCICMTKEKKVQIDLATTAFVTNENFVGVTIDSGILRRHWEHFDPKSEKLQTLASALSPCYLRVGGNDADFLIFREDDTAEIPTWRLQENSPQHQSDSAATLHWKQRGRADEPYDGNRANKFKRRQLEFSKPLSHQHERPGQRTITNFNMSSEMYDQLHQFVSKVGWMLIFDLNVLVRSNGSWDPTNAIQLMDYTVKKGYKMAGWELGNEPDSINVLVKNFTISPEKLYVDYKTFLRTLQRFPQFEDAWILGPSLAQLSVDWRVDYFDSRTLSTTSSISSLHQSNWPMITGDSKPCWPPSHSLRTHSLLAHLSPGFKENPLLTFTKEPNIIDHLIHFYIGPEELARDYKEFKAVVATFEQFHNSYIVGPSVTQLQGKGTINFYKRFLKAGGASIVTAATFHQYYMDSADATVERFTDPSILNVLFKEVEYGVNLTRDSGSKARVWLGETSTSWGGGATGLSDSYVAAFMWLDKLGISAAGGLEVVIRQSFYGYNYSLIDNDSFKPLPDYWLTLLYKLLVGNRVLKVVAPINHGSLRVYAHCAATKRSGYKAGSVVVYVLNLYKEDQNLTFPDFPDSSTLHVYSMEPEGGNLKSKTVLLNGQPLEMVNNSTLPSLLKPVTTQAPVTIKALTYSFIVLPEAQAKPCL